jgi:predicted DNA-binding ribbon-helix-helix protein
VIKKHYATAQIEHLPGRPIRDALREIANHEHMAISALVATIDHDRTTNNLSSAIRVFVLDHFRRNNHIRNKSELSGSAVAASKKRP